LKIPITILSIIGVVNAVNMTDGLDGLAGGISLIAFITFGVLAYINNQRELMLLSVAMSGALIGFLRYNWNHGHQFHMFMGDMGSFLLGFSLAFLSISITQKNETLIYPVAPLLILAVPITDTITVMVRRKMKGKSPFQPDKGHLHHILLRLGFSKKDSVKFILLLTSMFSIVAIVGMLLKIHDAYLFMIFLLFFVSYFAASFYLPQLLRYRIKKIGKEEFGSLTEMFIKVFRAVTGSSNRRMHKRFPVKLPFALQIQNSKESIGAQSLDIGVGGLSAKIAQNISVGEEVNVNLFLHEDYRRRKITSIARVVWAREEGDGKYYSYGLKFVEIERNQFRLLHRFLMGVLEGANSEGAFVNRTQTQQHI
jgi:hypothetical protein